MNLREIIASTRNYNFHSHTQFCDGRESMEAMATQAVRVGMEHYGFSPHSPIPVPSSCNMKHKDVAAYIAEYNRLKNLYAGRINLYLSMEIDYLGDRWGATNPFFNDIPLDYKLSSVHFIPSLVNPEEEIDVDGRPAHFAEKMARHFDGDIRYVVDTFYSRTLEMIERGGFDIIGHFDKIGFNASSYSPGIEKESWYRRHIDNMIDALAATDIIVEVNTKAAIAPVGATEAEIRSYCPRFFPSPQTVRRIVAAGLTVAVNSDAHYSSRITAGRLEAFAIIDGTGYFF